MPHGMDGADILAGWQNDDGTRIAAIELALEPDWKTYWRVPGEAGIPPDIDFSGSTNVKDVEIIWPTPIAFEQEGTRSIGYKGNVILPLRITAENPSEPVELNARLDIGICNDVCVPASLDLYRKLDGRGRRNDIVMAAMVDTPRRAENMATCTAEKLDDGVRVHARIDIPGTSTPPAMFEIRGTPMWTSQTKESREGRYLIASVDFVPPNPRPFDMELDDLRITILDAQGAIQIDGCTESRM